MSFGSRVRFAVVAIVFALMGCSISDVDSKNISIRALRGLYRGYPVAISQNLTIEGVVVSDDSYGEFSKRIVVEDSSGGIMVLVDSDSLHSLHKVGDVVRIECQGLTLGSYYGSLRLGTTGEGYEVEHLSVAKWREVCSTIGVAEREPVEEARIGELMAPQLSTRLRFGSVRFVEEGEKWAPDGVDATRHLVDCLSPQDTLAVRLSGRSAFAQELVPSGECAVVGVLDYHYDHYQLLIATCEDVLPLNEK